MLACALSASCETPADPACSPACQSDSTCDAVTNTCITPRLEPFDGPTPGRAVRLEIRDKRAFLAMIHPTEDLLLVGEATPTEAPSFYTLLEFKRRTPKKVALATSANTVAVAWLDADSLYRIAMRRLDGPADDWQIFSSQTHGDLDADDYRGSQDFDLSISAQGLEQSGGAEGSERARLVFHDARTRALRIIDATFETPSAAGSQLWSLQNIDDPADQADTLGCSAAQRVRVGRGIGFEPDIIHQGASTYIAYRDADCGDLRLARHLDGQWQITLVDAGDSERGDAHAMARGNTGGFASLNLDSRGNLAIAYQDMTRGQVRLALERAASFDIEVVDTGLQTDAASRQRKHQVGGFASLVFDEDDIPWVAYLDATSARIRLSHRSRRFGANGHWVQRTLDADAPTGFSTSLGYSRQFGLAVAAEQLKPGADGLGSALQFLTEDAL